MTEHYFSEKQTSPFKPRKIILYISGREFEMNVAGGVFSPKKLDNGTKLLIEKARIEDGWRVLDLGCGYGIVGVALKKRYRSIDLIMSDVNTRAVKLTDMNVRLHKIDAKVIQSDSFKNKELNEMSFDTVLLNPPQTAGKEVCRKMIEESAAHLVDGGVLQIVARSQKGGKQLSKMMEEIFGNVSETAKGSGYRIYVSEKWLSEKRA